MTRITLHFPDEHLEKLLELGQRYNVAPEELLRVIIEDLVMHPDAAFEQAAEKVLEKNAHLFKLMAS
jgi:hypothetical protein